MKKVIALGIFCCAAVTAAEPQEVVAPEEELQELDQPNKEINGAYWGLGLSVARTHHKIDLTKTVAGVPNPTITHSSPSSTAAQIEASFLVGFGTSFWSKYYTGLELEVFRRFRGKTSHFDDLHVEHSQNTSFNFEGRLGYLFPKKGNMIYLTAGVSRLYSRAYFGDDRSKNVTSFGSFFPTVGVGFEHRINAKWNVRFDYRYVISSKERDQGVKLNNKTTYSYRGKPGRMSFRIAVTRNINHSLY